MPESLPLQITSTPLGKPNQQMKISVEIVNLARVPTAEAETASRNQEKVPSAAADGQDGIGMLHRHFEKGGEMSADE